MIDMTQEGCNICTEACPFRALKRETASKDYCNRLGKPSFEFILDEETCSGCGNCEVSCPAHIGYSFLNIMHGNLYVDYCKECLNCFFCLKTPNCLTEGEAPVKSLFDVVKAVPGLFI